MLLRNVNTGGLMLYDISNNQITGTFFLGNVGLDWQYAGVAPEGPPTDRYLRQHRFLKVQRYQCHASST
jgi:hypothetical protein